MNQIDDAACTEAWAKYTGLKAWPKSVEFAAGFAAALEYRGKQAEPVGRFIKGDMNRAFELYPAGKNLPNGTELYTHAAPAVAQEPVVIVTGTKHVICQCEKCKPIEQAQT